MYHQFDTIVYPNLTSHAVTSEAVAAKKNIFVALKDFVRDSFFKSNQEDIKNGVSLEQEFCHLPLEQMHELCLDFYLEKCKKNLLDNPFDGYLEAHRIYTSLAVNSKGDTLRKV